MSQNRLKSAWQAGLESWQQRPARERQAMALAALVLGAFLVWSVAIQPAWRTLRGAPAQLDALDAQLQTMQRLASEARELREATPVTAEQAAAALKAASERLGAKASLNLRGERAVLTANGLDSGALRQWLTEVRAGARARPVEVQLTHGPSGYTGTIALAVGGAP